MKPSNMKVRVIAGALLAVMTFSATALELKATKKPARAIPKADLVVYLVDEYYADHTIVKVVIKNRGTAKSGSAVVSGQNVTAGGAIVEASIPALEPKQVKTLPLKFSRPIEKGHKLKFIADSKKHVSESNENNNIKMFGY